MPDKHHIAFLCPRYLWAGGGSVIYTRHLAGEMAQLGYQVTIVADETDDFYEEDVQTISRDTSAEERALKKLALENKRGGYRLAKWLYRDGTQQLLRAGPYCPVLADPSFYSRFDVVSLMNSGSTAWTPLVHSALKKGIGATNAYAFPFFHPHEGVAAYQSLARYHRLFNGVCTLTDFEKKFMEMREWNRRIFTMGAGSFASDQPVDEMAFRVKNGVPVKVPLVLFMGRKIYNKGITHVIEAMDAVWDAYPDAWLALLGFSHNPDTWVEGYLDASRHSNKRSQVVNLNDVDDQTHEEAIAASSLLAAPSISDSFGMVFLDAWRHRKPVIACRNTCCETYISHERDGLLVGFGEVQEIANGIKRLIGDIGLSSACGVAGYEKWRTQFQWPKVAELFHQLISGDRLG